MSDFKEIINYLKLYKESKTTENQEIVIVDLSYEENKEVHEEDIIIIKKKDLNSGSYTNLGGEIIAEEIYLLEDGGNLLYYVKVNVEENNAVVPKYKRIPLKLTDTWETLEESTLVRKEISSFSGYYYSFDLKRVIFTNTLDEVVATNDVFIYHFDDINFTDGEEASFNYLDHEGYTENFGDQFLRALLDSSIELAENEQRRSVTINKKQKNGRVHSLPDISKLFGNYKLKYNYVEKGIRFNSFMAERAIKLEFNYFGSLLEFLNQTVFNDLDTLDVFTSGNRALFFQDYIRFVNQLLRKARGRQKLEVLYYIPVFVFKKIDVNFLWNVLDEILDELVTNLGLNVEDIVLKILEGLEESYSNKNIFLAELVNKKIKDKEPVLERLLYKIDGDNFQKLLKYMWSLWKDSSFSEIDPKQNKWIKITDESPVLLDYRSDKKIGFHVDNADIKWDLNKNKITVDLKVKTGVFVEKTIEKEDGNVTYLEEVIEVEKYQYHPLSPIALVNADNPKFIYKDEEQESKSYFKLPAFILFVREESAFWQNILTTIEYTADILSTISGVGNIIKVGRLYKVLNAGKKLTSTTRKLTKVITFAKAAVGVAEISSGTVNALLKLTGVADTELGREISKYLFYFEILALSGELSVALYSKIQKSAKTILAKEEVLRKTAKNAEETKQIDEVIEELRNVADNRFNQFNSIADPVADVLGAAYKSHPERLRDILTYIESKGGEVIYKSEEALGYSPGLSKGQPGQIHIHKEASISAWEHELKHFLDDEAVGFMGMRALGDTNFRVRSELNAYKTEIDFVKKLNHNDEIELIKKLKLNFKNELDYLTGRGKITDYDLVEEIKKFLK